MLGLIMYMTRGPMMIAGVVGGLALCCGLLKCVSCCRSCKACRMRACPCIKKMLLATGKDEFSDFDLMVMVHEAAFDQGPQAGITKPRSAVRVNAGNHRVTTDWVTKGVFQQYLQILVEQGTKTLRVDLLDSGNAVSGERVLATLSLDVAADVLGKKGKGMQDEWYAMKPKGKGVKNPKVKLTLVPSQQVDVEQSPLLSSFANQFDHGGDLGADMMMRQQIQKAEEEARLKAGSTGEIDSMEVLKQACSGPLDRFEGLGSTVPVYVAVAGPPKVRRWTIGIWHSKSDYENHRQKIDDLDMLKITSVTSDPTRSMVFRIVYFDDNKTERMITFRRTDRPRDVWVELLQVLITKAKKVYKETKQEKQMSREGWSSTTADSCSSSSSLHGGGFSRSVSPSESKKPKRGWFGSRSRSPPPSSTSTASKRGKNRS